VLGSPEGEPKVYASNLEYIAVPRHQFLGNGVGKADAPSGLFVLDGIERKSRADFYWASVPFARLRADKTLPHNSSENCRPGRRARPFCVWLEEVESRTRALQDPSAKRRNEGHTLTRRCTFLTISSLRMCSCTPAAKPDSPASGSRANRRMRATRQ